MDDISLIEIVCVSELLQSISLSIQIAVFLKVHTLGMNIEKMRAVQNAVRTVSISNIYSINMWNQSVCRFYFHFELHI